MTQRALNLPVELEHLPRFESQQPVGLQNRVGSVHIVTKVVVPIELSPTEAHAACVKTSDNLEIVLSFQCKIIY